MLAILNSLNAHNVSIFQLILMILVSKFMVPRALSDKTYLSLGLPSPLIRPSDRSYISLFPLPFYFSQLFLENVLLSLLFILNWHLRDINTEMFPRSLRSLES